eukprot:1565146-Amphidinium_carterae.3
MTHTDAIVPNPAANKPVSAFSRLCPSISSAGAMQNPSQPMQANVKTFVAASMSQASCCKFTAPGA